MATQDTEKINESTTADHQVSETSEIKQVDASDEAQGSNQIDSSSSSSSSSDEGQTHDEQIRTEANATAAAETADAQKEEAFTIEKGSGARLNDFQRQKADYFFHVNLDIENKKYITWEDVEFYLLFHVTTADKEGFDGGDLEARLSRSTRALWEFIHDQVPLEDGDRNKLTLDQLYDTWASLVDYVNRTNRLPSKLEDLVKVAFELYSSNNGEGRSPSIQLAAFDQLFQKMNLGRPYAIMAYKILTENANVPLDYEKIQSLVQSTITSTDDEHASHFLLPGFFKTITPKPKSTTPDSTTSADESESTEPTVATTEPEKTTDNETDQSQEQPVEQKPVSDQQNQPSVKVTEPQSSAEPTVPTVVSQPVPNEQQQQQKQGSIRQDDENIRQLLRFYRIDDGDIVEVDDGPVHRVVLVHPERPLPPYIQQNKDLLKKIQTDQTPVQPNNSQIKLEQRVASGLAQTGPSIPARAEQLRSAGARQVFPPLNAEQQKQQQQDARIQAAKTSTAPAPQANETPEKRRTISSADQEKLVDAVLKQLKPVIEKRVSEELRRIQSGEIENDSDDNDQDGFIPFPFLFSGASPFFGGAPARSGPATAQSSSDEQHADDDQSRQFDGLPPGAAFIPPPLLMAMMSDLARAANAQGDMPDFQANQPGPRAQGPVGVEGFMMFVNGEPMMPGGPFNFPPGF